MPLIGNVTETDKSIVRRWLTVVFNCRLKALASEKEGDDRADRESRVDRDDLQLVNLDIVDISTLRRNITDCA